MRKVALSLFAVAFLFGCGNNQTASDVVKATCGFITSDANLAPLLGVQGATVDSVAKAVCAAWELWQSAHASDTNKLGAPKGDVTLDVNGVQVKGHGE